jgi:hypothetical protein
MGEPFPKTAQLERGPKRPARPAALPDEYQARADRWETFALLRTVIDQSTSSLRTEALLKLAELEQRVTDAESLGDL